MEFCTHFRKEQSASMMNNSHSIVLQVDGRTCAANMQMKFQSTVYTVCTVYANWMLLKIVERLCAKRKMMKITAERVANLSSLYLHAHTHVRILINIPFCWQSRRQRRDKRINEFDLRTMFLPGNYEGTLEQIISLIRVLLEQKFRMERRYRGVKMVFSIHGALLFYKWEKFDS